jgi:hypothetical protein
MSPVSRGRKTRKGRARGGGRDAPILSGVHGEMVRAFEPLATMGDPLDVEIVALYLPGVEPGDPADLRAILQRRMFAMPYIGTPIGDEDYPRLDPADPDQRGILIEGEHPEWHDLLRDPSFEGEVDGGSPRLHLAIHEMIASQLWDDEPPEAWRAAQRLLATGADRHEVLHELGRVALEHVYAVLSTDQPVDPTAYRAALDAVGAGRL